MSHTPLPTHPTRKHPHTGLALQAVGFRRSGAPISPILGASPDDPPAPTNPPEVQRPDGVTEEEWTALGDPGRAAIVREREARQAAERQLAAARARPAPPKPADPPKPQPADPAKPSDAPDFAALIKEAVAAAVKPFEDRETERGVQEAAEKVQKTVADAAKDLLHDATDALTNIDLTTVVNDQGQADADKVKTALDDLIKRKPHLAKPQAERIAPPGIGGGAPAGTTEGDKVKAVLADMQKATGVRIPGTTN